MLGTGKAYIDGLLEKDCNICYWQSEDGFGEKFCKLYKKCSNPKYCKDNYAFNCPMFRLCNDTINRVKSFFEKYSKIVEMWYNGQNTLNLF